MRVLIPRSRLRTILSQRFSSTTIIPSGFNCFPKSFISQTTTRLFTSTFDGQENVFILPLTQSSSDIYSGFASSDCCLLRISQQSLSVGITVVFPSRKSRYTSCRQLSIMVFCSGEMPDLPIIVSKNDKKKSYFDDTTSSPLLYSSIEISSGLRCVSLLSEMYNNSPPRALTRFVYSRSGSTMIISSFVERKTLTISRFAEKDLPAPGQPSIKPFPLIRLARLNTIRLPVV